MTLTTLALALAAGCDPGAVGAETICGDAVNHLAACGVTDLFDAGECDATQQDLTAELLALSCEEAAERSISMAPGSGLYKLRLCVLQAPSGALIAGYENRPCVTPTKSMITNKQCTTAWFKSGTKAYLQQHRRWGYTPFMSRVRTNGNGTGKQVLGASVLVKKTNLSCKTTHDCRLDADGDIECRTSPGSLFKKYCPGKPSLVKYAGSYDFCEFLRDDEFGGSSID